MRKLFTIGYEGANIADFVATLQTAGVTILMDIREIPISRRPGFSKKLLSENLVNAGIMYRHIRDLGSPRDIRHELHAKGDYVKFFRDFSKYLDTQQELLGEIARDLSGRVALMCYERDPTTCHRRVVAERIENMTGMKTKHLGVQNGASNQRSRTHFGQSLSAA